MTLNTTEQAIVKRTLRTLRANYKLWARNFVRIIDKETSTIVPFRLNHVQLAVGAKEAELLRTKGRARLYILKGRQGGITTDQQARNMYAIWRNPHNKVLTLSYDNEQTAEIFEIAQRIIREWPRNVRLPDVRFTLDFLPLLGRAEKRELAFTNMDSKFIIGTAGTTRTGRGLTLNRIHASEFAFFKPDPLENLKALEPAVERPGTAVVLETTASVYDSNAHKFWVRSTKGETEYAPLFFPWWDCDPNLYRTPLLEPDEMLPLSDEEADLEAQYGLDMEQLKWRRQKMLSHPQGRAGFLQEYAEDPDDCWITAGEQFYDANILVDLKRTREAQPPVRSEQVVRGTLDWYIEQHKVRHMVERGMQVVIGVDTAEGGGGDRSAWVARGFMPTGRMHTQQLEKLRRTDPDTANELEAMAQGGRWVLLATYTSRYITPEDLAEQLNKFGRNPFGQTTRKPALLVIEKNMHGITVIRRLNNNHGYPIGSLYRRVQVGKTSEPVSFYLGWHTSAETLPILLSAGRDVYNAAWAGLVDPPSVDAISDGFAVAYDEQGRLSLTGRDALVAEMLAWVGRERLAYGKPKGGGSRPPLRWSS